MPTATVDYKMRNRCLLISILALASSAMLATSSFAAEAESTEHHGVSLKPQMLVEVGGFGITNSMLVTWIVAAGIIIFAQIATRRVKIIPSGIQNFWEWLVEGLHNFLENIIGRDLVRKGFWFCHGFHFYPVRELAWISSRNRNCRLGPLRRDGEFSRRSAVATRWQRRPKHDDRDVGRILRDVVCLGDPGQWCRRVLETFVWPKR
jgi:hypothetical protein